MSVNKFIEYYENSEENYIVAIPGRFQPFHLGHLEIYNELKSKFGKDRVYIVTANPKKLDEKNPLTFIQKKKLIEASGIASNKIIEMKGTAYNGSNLVQSIGKIEKDVKLIVSFSEKDLEEKKLIKPNGYYKKFESLNAIMNTSDKNGYVYVANHNKKINATNIRKELESGKLSRTVLKIIPNNVKYLKLLKQYFKI